MSEPVSDPRKPVRLAESTVVAVLSCILLADFAWKVIGILCAEMSWNSGIGVPAAAGFLFVWSVALCLGFFLSCFMAPFVVSFLARNFPAAAAALDRVGAHLSPVFRRALHSFGRRRP